jgi:V/A-type H+-transporting ATPase subunit E
MNGIERIIDKILGDAKSYAGNIIAEAQNDAGDIIQDAETHAQKIRTEARTRAEKEAQNISGRIKSASGLIERNRLLAAKTELIDRVFLLAKEKILNLNRDAYCDFLSALLSEAVLEMPDAHYLMSVNKKDRESAECCILRNNADIQLSDEAAAIEGGFILRRGDVETNCSLELIISGLRSSLESEIYKILFD